MLALVGGTIFALDRMSVLDQTQDPAERARRVGQANGIVVAYGDPSTFYVPPFLPEDAKLPRVDMGAAEPSAVWFALDGIEASLAQYPAGFVAKLIKAIFICGRMTFEGEQGGGTYGPAWLVLSAPSQIGAAAITLTSRLGVHHELSSFVYFNGNAADAWQNTVPENWSFAPSAAEQLKGKAAPAPAVETGFLNAYGATSAENDFNVYAEKMMTEMEVVMGLARRIPIIARKATLVRKSYAAIDPRMDAVFSALGMTGLK
jgi:hypothetical protein